MKSSPWQSAAKARNARAKTTVMSPEIWFHAGELVTLIAAGARVVRAANRVLDVMRDFPPHRHVNGHLIYPEGYQPTPVEELGARPANR